MKFLKYVNKFLKPLKKESNLNEFKNVLVVSNTGLGDTILATPSIKSLRKSFPNLNITFLVSKKMYPLFEDYQYVDDFIMYESGFFNQLKTISILKKKKIDTIFLFHSNGPEDIFFSILSGAKNIFKMTDSLNHEYKSIFYNKPKVYTSHIIEEKLDLIRFFNPSIIDKTLEISSKYYVNQSKTDKDTICVGIQLGTQDLYKIWPINKFIELVNLILENKNINIVLLGSGELEKNLSNTLIQSIEKKEKVKNYCGKTAINELPDLVKKLDLLITNDTGTFHLAVALEIPTISLFGPTDHRIYGPYQDLEIHDVIQKDGFFVNNKPKKVRTQEGMDLISVKEVYDIFSNKIIGFK
jgi:ADP-heptose:LPS heptosyltransferase|tara:strand:+ start:12644 stop:13705 length:1062 start_codon:yes stop_codon:yes gene_type:complete